MKKLLLIGLLLLSCGKSQDSGSDVSEDQNKKILSTDLCPLMVAKFGECAEQTGVKNRFQFNKLKDWLFEDCRAIRGTNPAMYIKLSHCIKMECGSLNNCLEGILGKREKK